MRPLFVSTLFLLGFSSALHSAPGSLQAPDIQGRIVLLQKRSGEYCHGVQMSERSSQEREAVLTSATCLGNSVTGDVKLVKADGQPGAESTDVVVHPSLQIAPQFSPNDVPPEKDLAVAYFRAGSLQEAAQISGSKVELPVNPNSVLPGTPDFNQYGLLAGISRGCEKLNDKSTCAVVNFESPESRETLVASRLFERNVPLVVPAIANQHQLGLFCRRQSNCCQPNYSCYYPTYYYNTCPQRTGYTVTQQQQVVSANNRYNSPSQDSRNYNTNTNSNTNTARANANATNRNDISNNSSATSNPVVTTDSSVRRSFNPTFNNNPVNNNTNTFNPTINVNVPGIAELTKEVRESRAEAQASQQAWARERSAMSARIESLQSQVAAQAAAKRSADSSASGSSYSYSPPPSRPSVYNIPFPSKSEDQVASAPRFQSTPYTPPPSYHSPVPSSPASSSTPSYAPVSYPAASQPEPVEEKPKEEPYSGAYETVETVDNNRPQSDAVRTMVAKSASDLRSGRSDASAQVAAASRRPGQTRPSASAEAATLIARNGIPTERVLPGTPKVTRALVAASERRANKEEETHLLSAKKPAP